MVVKPANVFAAVEALALAWFLVEGARWFGSTTNLVVLALFGSLIVGAIATVRVRVFRFARALDKEDINRSRATLLVALGTLAGAGSLLLSAYGGPHGFAAPYGLALEGLLLHVARRVTAPR
jgi:hypothetical protein